MVAIAIGLWLALRRARSRSTATEAIIAEGRARIRAAVDEETAGHTEEIRRTFARERADTISQLAMEERRLGEERRATYPYVPHDLYAVIRDDTRGHRAAAHASPSGVAAESTSPISSP